jgi:hypothetical protein
MASPVVTIGKERDGACKCARQKKGTVKNLDKKESEQ